MTRDRKLELYETLGSISWLLLDGAWMMEWSTIVAVLIVPTVLSNLTTFFYVERSNNSVLAVAVVNCWMLMNAFWILDDMYHMNAAIVYAKFMFFVSIGFLLVGLTVHRDYRQYVFLIFYRFRRFRISKNGTSDNDKVR